MVMRQGWTYIYEVRQIMDVVFEDTVVGGLQSKKVLIPGLDGFQLVLSVFCLPLRIKGKNRRMRQQQKGTD